MSSLSTLPKGDSAWLLRKSIQRIMQQVSVLETNIGSSTTGNSANTQVIFNDAGTLRGDAGLTYNKATDTLSTGSATITGDLTVDTSTLKVDSANNRVGIGTASPSGILHAANLGTAGTTADNFNGYFSSANRNANLYLLAKNTEGSNFYFGDGDSNTVGGIIYDHASNYMRFDANGSEQMRLNSTGLALGQSSSALQSGGTGITIYGSTASEIKFLNSTTGSGANDGTALVTSGDSFSINNRESGSVLIGTANTERLRIDSAGNCGIGVVPSAATEKTLQIGERSTLSHLNFGNGYTVLANNFIYNSGNKYIANGPATNYTQFDGAHLWYNAPTGTAGNTITLTQAMTLDASGNLLVGTTSALFNSRLRVKTSSTSASDYGVYVADSADALIFALRNDGLIYTGTKTASPYNNTTGSAANAFIAADGTLGRSTSSLKYKTDITDSTRGLADVLKLRPVTYKSKNGDDTIFGGLIAEEVHAAGLTEFVAYAPDNAPDAIHYSNMVSLLVAAIKELTARVQTLETR